MDDATGEAEGTGLRVAFDRRLKLQFQLSHGVPRERRPAPAPLPRLPDGGGGGAASLVPGHPHPNRRAAAAGRRTMLTLALASIGASGAAVRPRCVRRPPPTDRS